MTAELRIQLFKLHNPFPACMDHRTTDRICSINLTPYNAS